MGVDDLRVEVAHRFASPPPAVFALLTDVERLAGLGPEHAEAHWVGQDRGVGARFDGRNVLGGREWTVPCWVTVHDPPRAFAWQVGDPALPTATWTYALAPDAGGTLVTQTFRNGPGRSFLRAHAEQRPDRADALVQQRADQLAANMRTVLAAAARLL